MRKKVNNVSPGTDTAAEALTGRTTEMGDEFLDFITTRES
jgi:hypothetical protein